MRLSLASISTIAIALWATGYATGATAAADAFDAANRLYAESRYLEAVTAYEELLAEGTESVALHFNLGNAFYRSGQIGRAIAKYRQAEALAPRDPDVQANLRFARDQVAGPKLNTSWVHRTMNTLSVGEWTALASVAFWSCFLLLAAVQLKPDWKRSLRPWILCAGLVSVVLIGCVIWLLSQDRDHAIAVVISKEAVVRLSPAEVFESAFVARDGAEFEVLDQKEDWIRVSDGRKNTGWVQEDSVLVLRRGVRTPDVHSDSPALPGTTPPDSAPES